MLKRHVSGDERSMTFQGHESSQNVVFIWVLHDVNECKQKMLHWIVSSL